MITSLSLIFLLGLCMGSIFNMLRLPKLLGMILTGVILGPHMLNLLDNKILEISPELRQIALIIILTRAGLSLNLEDLKKVGRPAILMCFIPAIFEIIGFLLLGPILLNLSLLDSAILGAVIAAVSPAVIVPRMIKLMEEGYGNKKSIPQLIMAGASVDDIFVIVIFYALTSLAQGEGASLVSIFKIPVSIILGILLGIIGGYILNLIFKKLELRDTIKIIIMMSISFLFITIENLLENVVAISGLLAIMSMGIVLLKINEKVAKRLSLKYNKLWIGAEILLFVLVGATVDINYAIKSGISALIIILLALVFRMIGVFIALIKTSLNLKERIFCVFAYMPKATVQAAIGGIPLSLGLPCGEVVLTVAVIAILLTAPLGAILIDNFYKKLLLK